MTWKHTWEKKGSKDINIIGMENKKQMTICVSSSSDESLFSMQVIL
jgi:hypothetical protein